MYIFRYVQRCHRFMQSCNSTAKLHKISELANIILTICILYRSRMLTAKPPQGAILSFRTVLLVTVFWVMV